MIFRQQVVRIRSASAVEWARAALVAWSVVSVAGNGRAYAQVAAAVVDDGPRSIAELAPPAIPDAENAAAQIEAVARQLDNFNGDNGRFFMTPLGKMYEEAHDRGEPPTAEQAAAMREIMDRYADLDAALQRAAACEAYASRADFSKGAAAFLDDLLPRVQQFRAVQRYYGWRIRLLRLEGKHDEAMRRGVEMLRLARLHQNEPTIVACLVTIAVRLNLIPELYDALAEGSVSFEAHTALDAELALADDPKYFSRVLRTERAYTLSAQAEQNKPVGLGTLFGLGVGTGASDYLDAVIAASEGPWDEFRKQARDGGRLAKPTGFGVMADQLAPAVVAWVEARGREVAAVRSLRAFNALRLFAKMKKREATRLDELELPAEAMVDPFLGEPLKAKLTEKGWVIYSVMSNEQDDGGNFKDQLDYGVGPAGMRGD